MDFEDEMDTFAETETGAPSKFDSVWLGLIVASVVVRNVLLLELYESTAWFFYRLFAQNRGIHQYHYGLFNPQFFNFFAFYMAEASLICKRDCNCFGSYHRFINRY